MFNIFKCKHPANMLVVEKEATVKNIDDDFDEVTYHLICLKCNENVEVKYVKMIGGVVEFLKR